MDENNRNYNENTNPRGDKPKHRFSFQTKLILSLSGALAMGIMGGALWQFSGLTSELSGGTDKQLEEQLAKDTYVNEIPLEDTTVLTNVSLENSVTKVIEDNMPSIVSITCQMESQGMNIFGQTYNQIQKGVGSGIIIGEDDTYYYISTNNHVVALATSIIVTFSNDQDVAGTVKGTDSTGDLAVVAVKKSDIKEAVLHEIKVAKLGDSQSISVGDAVVAIGNALGLGQSCTVGVVSALDREVTIDNVNMTLIQTDAAINAGNSGGALLNMKGEVVGINSAKLIQDTVEGMCFAIPITNAQTILSELINVEEVPDGNEGYLGMSGISVSQEESAMYNIPVGVYVREVPEGGAAAEAGVLVGDVITKLNGVGVATIGSLQNRATSYKAGTEVVLTIQRYSENGIYEEMELKCKLMSSSDFDGLKYSENTVTDQNGNSPDESPENGTQDDSQGNSDEEYQKWYEYFKEYFGG